MSPLGQISQGFSDSLQYIPFFGMVLGGGKNGKQLITRLTEAVIIAVMAGYISSYITLKVIEIRMDSVEVKVDKIFNDIYKPVIGD